MQRDDHETLKALGFEEDELRAMGLWEPATAPPERLIEAYLRRSKKMEDLATLRQHLRDITRYRWPDGYQIRHVWFEQLSASKTYVRRLEFERATQAVFDGHSKTLAFWKTDRFDRRGMGAVGRMLDEFDRRNASLVSTTEGLDSRQTGARIVFAILSEKARGEAKDIADRVNTGMQAHKLEGGRGTGLPPYGLMSPRLENGKPSGLVAPHPTEYKGSRRLADLLLGTWTTDDGKPGTKLTGTAAAKKLNAEGYTTRQGRPFSAEAVTRIVHSPMWGGMIPQADRIMDEYGNPTGKWVRRREPMLDAKGNPMRCGQGVVSPSEWFAIRAGFAERRSEDGTRGVRASGFLLTGLVRCSLCKGLMRHHRGYYRCIAAATKGTCKGISTRQPRLEAAVVNAWILHVTALEPGDPVQKAIARRWLSFSDPVKQAERERASQALADAQKRVSKLEDDYYVHGKMDEARYEFLSAGQRANIETMSAKLDELGADEGDLTVLLESDALWDVWESMDDVVDRRNMIKSALRAVYVLPAKGRGDQTPIEQRLADWEWVGA